MSRALSVGSERGGTGRYVDALLCARFFFLRTGRDHVVSVDFFTQNTRQLFSLAAPRLPAAPACNHSRRLVLVFTISCALHAWRTNERTNDRDHAVKMIAGPIHRRQGRRRGGQETVQGLPRRERPAKDPDARRRRHQPSRGNAGLHSRRRIFRRWGVVARY